MQGFGEIAENLRRSTVQVFSAGKNRGGGSGVIWEPSGLIVTNAHVTRSADSRVETWDGQVYQGRLVSYDPRRDLAALRIPREGLPAATAGDSNALRPGELAIAVGSPLGFSGALSTGVIHSVEDKWVRTSVRLAPGNSGGPLANARGHVVGINTAIVNGLGLAVPSREVLEFLRGGARPRLGVVLQPVAYDRQLGLMILEIERGSPAANASLRPGDILLGVNDRPFDSLDSLTAALDSGSPTLRLQFVRGERGPIREAVARLPAHAEAA
jgi:serine protease Do